MSIIQEALKRAQDSYASNRNLPQAREKPRQEPMQEFKQEPIQKPAISAPAKKHGVWAAIKRLIIMVCVIGLLPIATGFGIRALFLKMVTMDKERDSEDSIVDVQKTLPDKTVPETPTGKVVRETPANKAVPSAAPSAAVEQVTERLLALVSSGQANQSQNLKLNGIMYDEENPKAIINGITVRPGDVISGAVVISITENTVLLKYNNNDNQVEVTLKLKE